MRHRDQKELYEALRGDKCIRPGCKRRVKDDNDHFLFGCGSWVTKDMHRGWTYDWMWFMSRFDREGDNDGSIQE